MSVKFEFGPDRNIRFGVTCPLVPKTPHIQPCLEESDFVFNWIFVIHAGNKGGHKISDEMDFRPDGTIHFQVTHP